MTPFSLRIVTPDGVKYDGQAMEIVVRTTTGDIGIMAGHTNCVAPLGMGEAMVLLEEKKRYGACIGGMISVMEGVVSVVATTFEWSDEIDLARAEASESKARDRLIDKSLNSTELKMAEARLRRALVRKGVAGRK